MPPRMFQDLVVSGAVRSGPERARVLPVSLLVHVLAIGAVAVLPQLATELPPVAAAAPTPLPTFHPVSIVDVTPPTPPPATEVTRRARPAVPRDEPMAPAAGSGPALPSDLSHLGDGPVADDSPALCLANCTGGEGSGAILPGAPEGDPAGLGDPTPRRAGRDVTPPAKLSGNPPVYPDLARRARVEGDVVIECTIDPSGRVANAVVTHSIPLLDQAALDAVGSWRYRPTLINGVPVPVLMTVTVRFRLR